MTIHSSDPGITNLETAMRLATTNTGLSLADLSASRPVLVVFLRHSGCTFCREALADLAARRPAIEQAGTSLALVHMTKDESASVFFATYGLRDVPRISDPDRVLYHAFELRRGTLGQLFSPSVVVRGIKALFAGKHGIGRIQGDPLQMPGAFLIHRGRIVRAFRHRTAADRPDYQQLACPVAP